MLHGIVSISQPFIRPIIRGKAAADVEFGAKLDLSIVDGLSRIEKLSFKAYNESEVLKDIIERYYQTEGHYPERVLWIRYIGTGRTCSTASQKGSIFQALHWGDLRKIPQLINELNTLIPQIV